MRYVVVKNARLRQAVLLATVVIMPPAHGDGPDTSSWLCESCPFEDGYRAEYQAGASYLTDDAARFGNTRGYDEQRLYPELAGQGSLVSEEHRVAWQVRDLGIDAREISLAGQKSGTLDYRVEYRELPVHQFDTTTTVFRQASSSELVLPSGWIRAPLTGGFAALDESLSGRNISRDRRTLEASVRYEPLEALRLTARYKRGEHDGLRITGGPYFTQSSLLPAPFEFAANETELGMRYASESGFVKVSWFGSYFQNSNAALSWQNPFTSAVGAETASLAQAPDSSMQQLTLQGAWWHQSTGTVLGATAATGRLRQDDRLLAYTRNGSLDSAVLPRQHAGGRVDTGSIAVNLQSRPLDGLSLKFGWRIDERDNDTPVNAWQRVIVDTFDSGSMELNVPYSYRTTKIRTSGQYELVNGIDISAGFDRTVTDRDYQEVAEQTETGGWGSLRWRPVQWVNVRARAGTSEREIDRYDEAVASEFGQNPLLRKYNLAYRYRRYGKVSLTAASVDTPISFSIDVMYADDDYSQSRLGLQSTEETQVAADVSWDFGDNRHVYLHGGTDSMDADQLGSEQFAAPDWSASHADRFHTAGAGLALGQVADKVDIALEYARSVGRSAINVYSLASGPSGLPDLRSRLDSLRATATWRQSERLSYVFGVRYEGLAVSDWAQDGVAPDTIPVVLSLGARPYDYDVILVTLGIRYRPASGEYQAVSR